MVGQSLALKILQEIEDGTRTVFSRGIFQRVLLTAQEEKDLGLESNLLSWVVPHTTLPVLRKISEGECVSSRI